MFASNEENKASKTGPENFLFSGGKTTEPVHSELGASSYSRWKECPGSVKLSRGIPSKSSKYAEAGTAAHDAAAKILLGQMKFADLDKIESEDLDAIKVYVEYIERLRSFKPNFEAVEQKFDLSHYHPKLFGTADYVSYFKHTHSLDVVDYKHGAGVPVEVKNNKQLLYYALGALHANKFPIERLTITIVQPRCYHVDGPIRSWSVEPFEVLEFLSDLVEDAKATEKENASLNPGDHCRWCPAQGICPAIHSKAIVAAKDVFDSVTTYDPVKLAKTLGVLPQIESWVKAVREFAYREAEMGRCPPGYKLVDKRASRKWADGFDPETYFGELDAAYFFEKKLKSPAQVEKLFAKKHLVAWEIAEQYVVKESSGKNLVPNDDSRPETSLDFFNDQ